MSWLVGLRGLGPRPGRAACPNPNALGVSRTVEIDTTGGPGFGFEHYKVYDFLLLKEVVLTFDDGPQVGHTHAVLDALAAPLHQGDVLLDRQDGGSDCRRSSATSPRRGHTIGTHTWSHADLSKMKDEAEWKAEIEKGVSAVRRARRRTDRAVLPLSRT